MITNAKVKGNKRYEFGKDALKLLKKHTGFSTKKILRVTKLHLHFEVDEPVKFRLEGEL